MAAFDVDATNSGLQMSPGTLGPFYFNDAMFALGPYMAVDAYVQHLFQLRKMFT